MQIYKIITWLKKVYVIILTISKLNFCHLRAPDKIL